MVPFRKGGPMRVRYVLSLLLAAWALSARGVSPAQAASPRSVRDLPAWVPGEVLVKYREGIRPEAREAVSSALSARRSSRPRFDRLALPPGLALPEALRRLKDDPAVEWAQPNHRFYALCLPGDPYTSGNLWPLAQIEAAAGWDAWVDPATCPATVPGSASVTVAVVDSGVFAAHPDLAGVLAAPSEWLNAVDGGTDVSDGNGHGTFLCGLIGAVWDGTLASAQPYPSPCAATPPFRGGIAGIAGKVTILPVKVLDSEGYGSTESIVEGIDHAVARGARILNLSLGGTAFEQAEKEAVDRAVAAGCIVVAAAGNDGGGVLYPAAYPPVVAVGATGPDARVASYSNRGGALDLVAPGGAGTARNPTEALATEILSILACPTPEGYYPHPSGDSHYGTGAGTSFAVPYVSAAMALVWGRYPGWTARQVVDRVVSSTRDLGTPGWDRDSGYGLLNLRRALTGETQVLPFAKTFNSPNPFDPSRQGATNITLVLDAPARVELEIRDAVGTRVLKRTYEPSELNPATPQPQFKSFYVSWDGRNGEGKPVVSGVYPYTVKANGVTGRNKIVVLRGRP